MNIKNLTNIDKQKIEEIINDLWIKYKEIPGTDLGDIPFWDSKYDLESIDYLYYEGIDVAIEKNLLESGSLLILGNYLIRYHSYQLRKMGNLEIPHNLVLLHENLKEPIKLIEIISLFPEIDETDDEPNGFADNLSSAKEKLIEIARGGRFP